MTTFEHYRLAILRGKLRRAREQEKRIMDEIRAVEARREGVIDRMVIQLVRRCA